MRFNRRRVSTGLFLRPTLKKKGAFTAMFNDAVIISTFVMSFLLFLGFTEFCDRT
ncbi:hypothetical protein HMPREF0083_00956 [Aneurinibacillus aneurinilyticus ATCC 12856]|uniref:Uncharacterized protein n=1 Tax=Aneurinibacillus aneurinilyticus ATCC 12856 TaxID=649747 RepID=U1YJJ0_ANEAE|nr:hypothetical protein HMPREF0083_00956 [Aneurinibacillus aneurinilyticus ATCC 12856]